MSTNLLIASKLAQNIDTGRVKVIIEIGLEALEKVHAKFRIFYLVDCFDFFLLLQACPQSMLHLVLRIGLYWWDN